MGAPSIIQNCACPCGHSQFSIAGKPLARFFCHCRICQALYKLPFADIAAFWGTSITLPIGSDVSFRKYRPPPAVSRGTCSACGAPVVGFLRVAPFLRLAFIPVRNIPDPSALPVPGAHIFYHRRVRDVNDSIPKVEGYWPSELTAVRLMLKGTSKGDA